MLRNYLLIALRNFRGQGLYALLNVFGLSIGIASCLMIVLYVFDELRYDTFHPEADRLYRVVVHDKIGSSEVKAALTASALTPVISQEFSEVDLATRFYPVGSQVVELVDEVFTQDGIAYVDQGFLTMFGYSLLQGDKATALQKPNSLVITESTAQKYFGNYSALGNLLTIGDSAVYEVTGVIEDPLNHSHLSFKALASFSTLPNNFDNNWTTYELYNYLLLKEGTSAVALEEQLQTLIGKYVFAQMSEEYGTTPEALQQEGNQYRFNLQPITSIHLHSNLFGEFAPGGNVKTLYILIAIAVFLLLIACINFMNLATARYMRRAREVGVRKTLGSTRGALILQFLSEATLLSLLATLLGVVWGLLALPAFNNLTAKEIAYEVFLQPWLLLGLGALVGIVGLLSGSYPAFFLSGFHPTEVLKGGWLVRKGSAAIRNVLVIFQFSVSIGLIICTILAYQQLAYTRSKDLGFDKEQVMAVMHFDLLAEQAVAVKEAIARQSVVVDASTVSDIIPRSYQATTFWQKNDKRERLIYWYASDYNHLKTMGIELVEGRSFSEEFSIDTMGVLLNETAARSLEMDNPVGAEISYDNTEDGTYQVLGVMKDFNFQSLHHKIEPMALFFTDAGSYLLVRVAPGDIPKALQQIETVWREYVPNIPFDYTFLDEEFDYKFRAEQRLSRVFTLFSVLTIVVAGLGLLGLAAYTTEQRTKEIGIRKTMGASTGTLVWLLSRNFTRLVLLAFGLSVPIAYLLMQSWLNQFAFRVQMGILPFLLAGLGALLLAWVTVGVLAYRTTQANLANVLRPE